MTLTISTPRQVFLITSAIWAVRVLAAVLLLGLSIKYKEVGIEGTRPFHTVVIAMLTIAGIYCGVARLPISFHLQPISLLLYACAGYLLCAGVLAGDRGIKDGIYMLANSVAIYWLVAGVTQSISISSFLHEARGVARLLSLAVALPTLVVWVWPIVGVGLLKPSPSYLARAHGMLGDPTNFGCFCSVALLFTVAGRSVLTGGTCKLRALFDQVTIALLMLAIIASGSRMAIFGCAVGFSVLLIFRQLRWKAIILPALASALVYPALLYVKAAEISNGVAATVLDPKVVMGQLAEGAFRIDEAGPEARQSLLSFAFNSYRGMTITEKVFGCGYQCIESLNRSSHIGYLDLLVNYGLVFLFLLGALLLSSAYAGLLLAKQGQAAPLALLGFFVVATSFLSWPFNAFFNAPFFGALIGLACLAISHPSSVALAKAGRTGHHGVC